MIKISDKYDIEDGIKFYDEIIERKQRKLGFYSFRKFFICLTYNYFISPDKYTPDDSNKSEDAKKDNKITSPVLNIPNQTIQRYIK